MVTSTYPPLRVAGEEDIDGIADLIGHAFVHMPIIRFLVPDESRRLQVSRDWYRLYIAHAIGGAGQVVTTEDSSAAAVWFDRTSEASEPEDYQKRLADIAGEDLPRFEELDREMETHHPSEPHWHLLFLAVRPDRWSQGLGSALMEHTHTRLDAEGTAGYLEATSKQNRRLYQRHRYQDMNPATLTVSDGTALFRMWRPASRG